MYRLILVLSLILSGCNDKFTVTSKAYKSEHYVHVIKNIDNKLVKLYVPQKFYIFSQNQFQDKRCEVSKEDWVEIKVNQEINKIHITNCVYGIEALIIGDNF